jgi:hypothetical protein
MVRGLRPAHVPSSKTHRGGLDRSLSFDDLVGGEAVTFAAKKSDKGPRASRVRAAAAE